MLNSHLFKALLLWIALGIVSTGLITRLDFTAFSRQQQGLLSTLEQQLSTNLSQAYRLLDHGLMLTREYRAQPDLLEQHLSTLPPLSPALDYLYLLQPVTEQNLGPFERQMRQRIPDFQLQGLSPMTPPTRTRDSGNPIYYPIILSLPQQAPARLPVGLDLSLSPVHRSAIQASHHQPGHHLSPPYQLESGPVRVGLYGLAPEPPARLLAFELTLSELAGIQDLPDNARLTLSGNEISLPLLDAAETGTGYPFRQSLDIEAGTHDWVLTLEQPFGWQQLSWGALLLALGLNTLGSLLFFAWIRQQADTRRYRQESRDVTELQQHLHKRTEELQYQLRENQHLTHRILDIQERERRHLAQELHDELGQCLTAIRTDAGMLMQDYPDRDSAAHQHAENIDSIAAHIYDVTYDLMRALRPTLLDDLGLVDALRELTGSGQIERLGLTVELALKGPLNDMEERYNITLYRLIQEALTNIMRHADGRQVRIQLYRLGADSLNDRIELDIEDDGCGFDPEDPSHNRRFGLLGMQARVRALSGSFDLSSRPGEGTRLKIRMPLVAAEVRGEARPSATGSAVPPLSDAVRQPA